MYMEPAGGFHYNTRQNEYHSSCSVTFLWVFCFWKLLAPAVLIFLIFGLTIRRVTICLLPNFQYFLRRTVKEKIWIFFSLWRVEAIFYCLTFTTMLKKKYFWPKRRHGALCSVSSCEFFRQVYPERSWNYRTIHRLSLEFIGSQFPRKLLHWMQQNVYRMFTKPFFIPALSANFLRFYYSRSQFLQFLSHENILHPSSNPRMALISLDGNNE